MFPLLFRSPHHFSIQMLMFLSHAVPGHAAFLSSLTFPHRIVFASPVVLVTWTNHPNFHLLTAYVGSWDPITSASSSLMALLVLFTVFDIRVILQRHLKSKIEFLILQKLCWQRTTENTTILRSPAWMCLRCSRLSRFWHAVRYVIMGVILLFYFYFNIRTPQSPLLTRPLTGVSLLCYRSLAWYHRCHDLARTDPCSKQHCQLCCCSAPRQRLPILLPDVDVPSCCTGQVSSFLPLGNEPLAL